MADVWDAVDALLEKHRKQYDLSFGMEYSSTVDWVAEFTPRRNHPLARKYGEAWLAANTVRDDAIRAAIHYTQVALGDLVQEQ